MGDPVLQAKLVTAMRAVPGDVAWDTWDPDQYGLRALLLTDHHRAYLTNAVFHSAVDAFCALLPAIAARLDPIQRSALAAILPDAVDGLARAAGAWAQRNADAILRLEQQPNTRRDT